MGQFRIGEININGRWVNFKLAKILGIKLALTFEGIFNGRGFLVTVRGDTVIIGPEFIPLTSRGLHDTDARFRHGIRVRFVRGRGSVGGGLWVLERA